MLDARTHLHVHLSTANAGRSARETYKHKKKLWRKRTFWHPWLIYVLICLLISVVGFVAERHSLWPYYLGASMGLLVTTYLSEIMTPPDRIKYWQKGYEGERKTAQALAPLEGHRCAILHDLPDHRRPGYDDKGNMDHVIVSRAGVFLMDSKWLGGSAAIKDGRVHVKMLDDDFASVDGWLAEKTRRCATRLYYDIAKRQVPIGFVRAVIVFWNDFEQGVVDEHEGHKITFVHGERLAEWLREEVESGAKSEEWVAEVTACIRETRPLEHGPVWREKLLP